MSARLRLGVVAALAVGGAVVLGVVLRSAPPPSVPPAEGYVGSDACARCHADVARLGGIGAPLRHAAGGTRRPPARAPHADEPLRARERTLSMAGARLGREADLPLA